MSERRPGDVGLTFCRGISGLRREIDFLAGLQADVRLLPVAAPAGVAAEALHLAADVDHLDAIDLDLEHRLDRSLHLGLRRVGLDLEDHLVVSVGDLRALFGHDRREQHQREAIRGKALRLHVLTDLHPNIPSNWATAAFVSSTWLKRI